MVCCYKARLTLADLEIMEIGMCLDYIDEWIEQSKSADQKTRKASQNDFDSF
jgi:hypothetical protein